MEPLGPIIAVLCSITRQTVHLDGHFEAGMVGLAPKWVRLAPNGTNPGLFQIRFQYIWCQFDPFYDHILQPWYLLTVHSFQFEIAVDKIFTKKEKYVGLV